MIPPDKRKRIVLVDDHALVRQGLERLLNVGDEFVVCEEAGDATEGMEMVREMRPDAVIVDVGLPGGPDGIELTEKLRSEFPRWLFSFSRHMKNPNTSGARRAPGQWVTF
jgi:DNA-binding NarL/FixJ family response regulator